MARTYTTVGWEDGTILQPATVTVQGTQYNVEPQVVSGTTPINATNLRKMDNEIKRIVEEDIPSTLDVVLIAVTDTAPSECAKDDKYYNTTDNKIYTATATNTWSQDGDYPVEGIMYILFGTQSSYAYNGTTLVSVGGGSGETITQQPTAPENPEENDLWIDTTNGNTLKRYNGTSWELVSIYSDAPIGTIIAFAGATPPSDYLLCDGTAISRTTYADLFAVIGTTYGNGDGSTTFNLPNIKGRVLVGQDTSQTEFDTLGETGGSKYLQEHTHKFGINASFGTPNNVSGGYMGGTSGYIDNVIGTAGTGDSGNLQPYVVVNYIIKVVETTPRSSETVNIYSESTTDAYSCSYMNSKLENNIIVGQKVAGEHTIISDGNYYKIPLAYSHSIGNKLTLVDGDIKIGTGVNKIKVEATCQYKGGTASYFIVEIVRVRNNTSSRLNLAVGTAGTENTLGTPIEIAEVQENDLIRINYSSTSTDARIVGDSTKLYVEVVE